MTKAEFYENQKLRIKERYDFLRKTEKKNRTAALEIMSAEFAYTPKTLIQMMCASHYQKPLPKDRFKNLAS